jgi:hypothetical protein
MVRRSGAHRGDLLLAEFDPGCPRPPGLPRQTANSSEASFAVEVFGITAYRYRHSASERWRGNYLIRLAATSDDDGKLTRVRADAAEDDGPLAGCVMSFAYWHPAMRTQTRLLECTDRSPGERAGPPHRQSRDRCARRAHPGGALAHHRPGGRDRCLVLERGPVDRPGLDARERAQAQLPSPMIQRASRHVTPCIPCQSHPCQESSCQFASSPSPTPPWRWSS